MKIVWNGNSRVTRSSTYSEIASADTSSSALLKYDEATTVSELAETTGSENGGNPERIEISLIHSHLPRLEGIGIVEYDPETGMVEPTTAVTDLEPFFELVESW